MGIGAGTFAAGMLFLIAYLSFVRRIKVKNLWKNSICKWFLQLVADIYKNRSSLTKIVLIGSGMLIINLLMTSNSANFILLGIAVDVYAIIKFAQRSIEKEKIKKGITRIANEMRSIRFLRKTFQQIIRKWQCRLIASVRVFKCS